MRFLLGSRSGMQRKCRELLLLLLSPTVFFNVQNMSNFYIRKSIKNLKKLASRHYIEKSISKTWHKIRTQ